ncbi:MPEG1-like protein [Mya arenaria]|uniref:MPEG1-like protein n=1 Tax=Mya arenaria TaxID=6604 RepID=A0ABY7ED67_MYAAR|nr:MPEG1-like protein [Mya arenaria]
MAHGVYIIALAALVVRTAAETLPDLNDETLKGHPSLCKKRLGILNLKLLEPLPGQGWDNLQNEERNMVVKHEYLYCKTTADERFLIPDGFNVYPIKSTHIRSDSEVFEHWDNFTSSDSKTINANAGLNVPIIKISGKYSKEYEKTKTTQYKEQTQTIRLQFRNSKYWARIGTEAKLTESFRNRLVRIGQYIMDNKTEHATYDSELLVREYGTHVVTGVELGANLIRAELSFGSMLKFLSDAGFDKSESYTTSSHQLYTENKESTEIWTDGGIEFRMTEEYENTWLNSIEANQVPLDRAGVPLHFYINDIKLPDVPDYVVDKVYYKVRDAVLSYYEHNVVRGCTHPDSPNFNYVANYDDGSCNPPLETYYLGGVYQTCTMYIPGGCTGTNLCLATGVNNPLTGLQSCPDGYEPIPLNRGQKTGSCSYRTSHSCGFLWLSTCYNYYTKATTANYQAYWCAPINSTDSSRTRNGVLFGGIYTTNYANPVTQSTSCPPHFYAIKVLNDLSICVSTNTELGSYHAVNFGGFHSCRNSNPFHTDNAYCPIGYSQHLAVIDEECQIDVCIEMGALKLGALPKIQLPPFMPKPLTFLLEPNATSTEEPE